MKTLLIAAVLLIAPVGADATVLAAEVASPSVELVVRSELRAAIAVLSTLAPLIAVLGGGLGALGLCLALAAAGRTPAQTLNPRVAFAATSPTDVQETTDAKPSEDLRPFHPGHRRR